MEAIDITVLTQDISESASFEILQLGITEANLIVVRKEESVAVLQRLEGSLQDAGESLAQDAVHVSLLGHASGEEVDVIRMLVNLVGANDSYPDTLFSKKYRLTSLSSCQLV